MRVCVWKVWGEGMCCVRVECDKIYMCVCEGGSCVCVCVCGGGCVCVGVFILTCGSISFSSR